MFVSYERKLYCFIILLLLSLNITAQIKCKIEHYSTEDGLSHNKITSIVKCRDGFMWFGTWDGIDRFDGHNFITYKSHLGDTSGLKNNRIDRIVEDKSDFLWVRAYDYQYYRFDKKSKKFLSIASILARSNISNIRFDNIIPTSKQQVWLTTVDKGLFCVNNAASSSPEIIRYGEGMEKDFRLPSDVINFLHEDQQHNIWIGTDKGLCLMSESSSSVYRKSAINVSDINNQSFTTVIEDQERIWFGTNTGEVFFYKKSTKQFKSIKISASGINALCISRKKHVVYILTSANEIVTINASGLQLDKSAIPGEGPFVSIYEDRSEQLWIGPEKDGVVKYSPGTKVFKYFFQKKDATLNTPAKGCSVFEDSENRVWVSINNGGFGYYNPVQDKLEYFYNEPGAANHVFSNVVSFIYLDSAGILWMHTADGGIEKIIFQKNDLTTKLLVASTPVKTDNEVRGIYNDNKGRIWLASKSGNIYIQQVDGKRLTNFFVNEPVGGIGLVYTILQDRNGKMWLGTKGNGLFSAEPIDSNGLKYKLTHYQPDKNDLYSLSSNLIYSLLEDKKGRIWVGTFENGPNLVVKGDKKIKFINARNEFQNYPNGILGKIRHLQQDANNNIWIATTNGLLIVDANRPDPRDYQFVSYGKNSRDKTSLGNNDLQYIFRDSKNRMWIATSGGGLNQAIGQVNKDLSFKLFTRKDGLPSDYILSITEDNQGNLWLGTENGLCKFNPDKLLFRNYDSYDGLMKPGFSEASAIKLSTGNLLFGTLNGYLIFNPARIAHQKRSANMAFTNLQVNNKDVPIGNDHSPLKLDINNTSTIELKYNENIISIDFTVLDYKSNDKQAYAYRLTGFDKDWNNVINQYRATYTNLQPGTYIFEVKSLSEDLYEKLPVKKLAITILPPWWRTTWAYLLYVVLLIIIIETVRRIATTMIRLRNRVTVQKKLTDLKINFFTNISHELRTPLTLIINPVDEVLRQENLSPKAHQYLTVARKNTNRMVRFINQLLDFQKVQSGNMKLKISETEIVTLVKNICGYFSEVANEKEIELLVTSNITKLMAWIDAEKIDIVIYNLLSNAFKFSPKGKVIEIKIHYDSVNDFFTVDVSDQGIGVPADKLNDIFELYYEVQNTRSDHLAGTGIGLALSKDIVELHGGKIRADNNASEGLTVRVELKIGKDHFNDDVVITDSMASSDYDILSVTPFTVNETQTFINQENKPVVLVVDDNSELRKFLADQLEVFYQVIEAENGKEGFERAITMVPDLILSDVMMPEMDGIEFLDKLKNKTTTSHIPVILLTAKSSIEDQIVGLSYGADYYITKPFDVSFILASIRNLLQQRKKLFESLVSKNKTIESELEDVIITSKDEIFLKEVIATVENGMEDPQFSIDKVAESLLMGRTTFYKKFKSLTGMAPVEFIREMRVKTAKKLLDEGHENIASIAYEVGFSSPKYFSTCFKEKYNISPTEYLKTKKSSST